MSSLTTLKLVNAQKPQQVAPIINRRNNLSTQLFHQIELAKAFSENRQYVPTHQKVIKDKISGERRTIEKAIRLKQMWWSADNKVYLQVKYSNKVLELSKGKNSVEVSNPTELISAIKVIKKAVDEGALDSQIELVSKSVRARFVK
jgi:hypothetical protein